METTLFWIGCGLGAYAWVLRQFFKREFWLSRRTLVVGLHLFFTMAVGSLVGFIVSASVDLRGPNPTYPMGGAAAGLVWGIFQLVRSRGRLDGGVRLLQDDREWVETSFSAVLLAAAIMYCVVQAFKIPSGSMRDTLLEGDHLFVNKFIYGIRVPFTDRRIFRIREVRRRDIIVFECPPEALSPEEREKKVRKDFIKRAAAIAGDAVEIRDKTLYVNGERMIEPYGTFRDPRAYPPDRRLASAQEYQQVWQRGNLAQELGSSVRDNFGPVKVPAGHCFVMGDNRDGSYDSRFWGPLPLRMLKGKAWILYWPLRRIRWIR